jgi:hypothetical protein
MIKILNVGGSFDDLSKRGGAVVRALAAETINSVGGCDFQPKVQGASQPGLGGKQAAFLADCWVFGRLHKGLARRTGGRWWPSIRRISSASTRHCRVGAAGALTGAGALPALRGGDSGAAQACRS